MDEHALRAEAEQLFSRQTDELYGILAPEDSNQQLYSRGGQTIRGKAVFVQYLQRLKGTLCHHYKNRPHGINSGIDLVVLLSLALLADPTINNVHVVPMATLVVKIGLEEICTETSSS